MSSSKPRVYGMHQFSSDLFWKMTQKFVIDGFMKKSLKEIKNIDSSSWVFWPSSSDVSSQTVQRVALSVTPSGHLATHSEYNLKLDMKTLSGQRGDRFLVNL